MNLPVEKIQNGLVSLRESGLVEPMGLRLSVHGWQWFKYKARPGHPKPGNAGRDVAGDGTGEATEPEATEGSSVI
jgi:hypothetical protein